MPIAQIQKEKLLTLTCKGRYFNIWALKSSLVIEYNYPFTQVPFPHHLGPKMGIFKNKNSLLMRSLRVSLSHPSVFGKQVELKLNLLSISFLLSFSPSLIPVPEAVSFQAWHNGMVIAWGLSIVTQGWNLKPCLLHPAHVLFPSRPFPVH